MLALSFMFAIFISSRRAKKFGLDPQYILDLSVWVIVSGVLGSRLLYVVFHLNEYESFIDIFALWQGGATLYGGLLLAIFASWYYARRKKFDFLLLADVVAPSLALGIMLTRVGCFMSGCCYGKETTLPWGVVFPPDSAAGAYCMQLAATAGHQVAIHPSQLYASGYGLVIFLLIMYGGRFLAKRGAAFGLFVLCYGVFRFGLDFTRIYETNMRMIGGLTLNQLISIGLMALGIYLLTRKTTLQTVPVKTVPAQQPGGKPGKGKRKKSSKS